MNQREIKFRAWDTKKQMMTGFEFAITSKGSWLTQALGLVVAGGHYPGTEFWKRENTSRLIPMQYTGLKDKNGKEIYEGDVVKGRLVHEVVFEKGGFHCLTVDGTGDRTKHPLSNNHSAVEVIGNIYENPDLLN